MQIVFFFLIVYWSTQRKNREGVGGFQRSLRFLILVPTLRVIHQGTVDNNLGPDRLANPKALEHDNTDNQPLIARPLSGSPNCAWLWVAPVWGQGILPYSYYQYRASDIAA